MTCAGVASLVIAGEELRLLPERAAFWAAQHTLIVADLHVGKAAAFRAAGVPIPIGSTSSDLNRLTEVIRATGAERMVILGDLYHAREGMSEETLGSVRTWRRSHSQLEIRLIRGNHDRKAGSSPIDFAFQEVEDPMVEAPFVFRHDPVESKEGYVLCGHVHPAAVMKGRGVRPIRLSCYCFSRRIGILPAFGAFTGTARIRPTKDERVFVIAGGEVVEARR